MPNQNPLNPFSLLARLNIRPNLVFGVIIITALIAFEVFNFSTTDYALRDLLGDLQFAGISWGTLLTVAFCGIDFAGIARLFVPDLSDAKEAWYLFGAWMLAATVNAILTWWGVSMAVVSTAQRATAVVDPSVITKVVPVFVAALVLLIRVMIIGTLSAAAARWADNPQPVVRNHATSLPASAAYPRQAQYSPRPPAEARQAAAHPRHSINEPPDR